MREEIRQDGERSIAAGGSLIHVVGNVVRRAPVWAAVLVFLLVNAAQLLVSGVRMGGDSGMYLDGARALATGESLSVRQPSYAGYIAFVAFIQSIGAGVIGVALAQIAAACGAAIVVGKMAAHLAGPLAGVLAILLFAADFDTNRWHAFILSDSLFLSLLALAVWLAYRALPARAGAIALALAAMLAAALVRPEGWFLIPAALLFWVLRGTERRAVRWAGVSGLVVAAALLAVLLAPRLSGNLTAVGPAEMLRLGQTIWDFNGWRVSMPSDPVFEDGQATTGDAITYGMRHPISTATLMAARVGVHFAHVRPFFSTAHNVVVVAWLVPLYALTLWAFWHWRHHRFCQWTLAAIASQTVVVALTHADWDGRYLAHVLPLMYPFAGAAIALGLACARNVGGGSATA